MLFGHKKGWLETIKPPLRHIDLMLMFKCRSGIGLHHAF